METMFKIYHTIITDAHKNFIKNHFSHLHEKWPTYKKWFFRDNPQATNVDFSSWMPHHMCEDWEVDIQWMSPEEFKYHWPSHYSFIMDIHSEEE